MRAIVALLLMLAAAGPVQAVDKAAAERQFRLFLDGEIWPQAKAEGVPRAVFDQALGTVRLDWSLPDLIPPGAGTKAPKDQHQAEFRSPAGYFAAKVVDAVVAGGRRRAASEKAVLRQVERRTGVPAPILLAIWGRESGFGTAKVPKDAFTVLATKAFMATRKDMFRAELVAALRIVAGGHAAIGDMKSSWAGALGQPQFMPSKFLAHAADGDGDGRPDIWRSTADTLASIGRYLQDYGWQAGRGWGVEVAVPDTVSCVEEGPDRGHTLARWAARGLARADGRPFAAAETDKEFFLLMPAGRGGPAFLVTPNFYVLKEYNESDLYALFVGHAADRIAGADGGFRKGFDAVDALTRGDVAAMQRALERLGHDVGGADGLPGFKTRRSLGAFQESRGDKATCWPDANLKADLAGG